MTFGICNINRSNVDVYLQFIRLLLAKLTRSVILTELGINLLLEHSDIVKNSVY